MKLVVLLLLPLLGVALAGYNCAKWEDEVTECFKEYVDDSNNIMHYSNPLGYRKNELNSICNDFEDFTKCAKSAIAASRKGHVAPSPGCNLRGIYEARNLINGYDFLCEDSFDEFIQSFDCIKDVEGTSAAQCMRDAGGSRRYRRDLSRREKRRVTTRDDCARRIKRRVTTRDDCEVRGKRRVWPVRGKRRVTTRDDCARRNKRRVTTRDDCEVRGKRRVWSVREKRRVTTRADCARRRKRRVTTRDDCEVRGKRRVWPVRGKRRVTTRADCARRRKRRVTTRDDCELRGERLHRGRRAVTTRSRSRQYARERDEEDSRRGSSRRGSRRGSTRKSSHTKAAPVDKCQLWKGFDNCIMPKVERECGSVALDVMQTLRQKVMPNKCH